MEAKDFSSFGISEGLQKAVKQGGKLEVVLGISSLILSLFSFFMFICAMEKDGFGGDVLAFFGFTQPWFLNFFFGKFIIFVGSMYLCIGTFSLVAGINTFKVSKNPVSILYSKARYIITATLYVLIVGVMIYAFCVSCGVWLFGLLEAISLTLLVLIVIVQIYVAIKLPDKKDVLDVQNLSQKQLENINDHANPKQQK